MSLGCNNHRERRSSLTSLKTMVCHSWLIIIFLSPLYSTKITLHQTRLLQYVHIDLPSSVISSLFPRVPRRMEWWYRQDTILVIRLLSQLLSLVRYGNRLPCLVGKTTRAQASQSWSPISTEKRSRRYTLAAEVDINLGAEKRGNNSHHRNSDACVRINIWPLYKVN